MNLAGDIGYDILTFCSFGYVLSAPLFSAHVWMQEEAMLKRQTDEYLKMSQAAMLERMRADTEDWDWEDTLVNALGIR